MVRSSIIDSKSSDVEVEREERIALAIKAFKEGYGESSIRKIVLFYNISVSTL
jgi:hypothetical protein